MAWVNVKGHRYYRRSKRVGGRVLTEHVGRGELANRERCERFFAARRGANDRG